MYLKEMETIHHSNIHDSIIRLELNKIRLENTINYYLTMNNGLSQIYQISGDLDSTNYNTYYASNTTITNRNLSNHKTVSFLNMIATCYVDAINMNDSYIRCTITNTEGSQFFINHYIHEYINDQIAVSYLENELQHYLVIGYCINGTIKGLKYRNHPESVRFIFEREISMTDPSEYDQYNPIIEAVPIYGADQNKYALLLWYEQFNDNSYYVKANIIDVNGISVTINKTDIVIYEIHPEYNIQDITYSVVSSIYDLIMISINIKHQYNSELQYLSIIKYIKLFDYVKYNKYSLTNGLSIKLYDSMYKNDFMYSIWINHNDQILLNKWSIDTMKISPQKINVYDSIYNMIHLNVNNSPIISHPSIQSISILADIIQDNIVIFVAFSCLDLSNENIFILFQMYNDQLKPLNDTQIVSQMDYSNSKLDHDFSVKLSKSYRNDCQSCVFIIFNGDKEHLLPKYQTNVLSHNECIYEECNSDNIWLLSTQFNYASNDYSWIVHNYNYYFLTKATQIEQNNPRVVHTLNDKYIVCFKSIENSKIYLVCHIMIQDALFSNKFDKILQSIHVDIVDNMDLFDLKTFQNNNQFVITYTNGTQLISKTFNTDTNLNLVNVWNTNLANNDAISPVTGVVKYNNSEYVFVCWLQVNIGIICNNIQNYMYTNIIVYNASEILSLSSMEVIGYHILISFVNNVNKDTVIVITIDARDYIIPPTSTAVTSSTTVAPSTTVTTITTSSVNTTKLLTTIVSNTSNITITTTEPTLEVFNPGNEGKIGKGRKVITTIATLVFLLLLVIGVVLYYLKFVKDKPKKKKNKYGQVTRIDTHDDKETFELSHSVTSNTNNNEQDFSLIVSNKTIDTDTKNYIKPKSKSLESDISDSDKSTTDSDQINLDIIDTENNNNNIESDNKSMNMMLHIPMNETSLNVNNSRRHSLTINRVKNINNNKFEIKRNKIIDDDTIILDDELSHNMYNDIQNLIITDNDNNTSDDDSTTIIGDRSSHNLISRE